MTSLYTPEQTKRMGRRAKAGKALVWGLAAASLAVCAGLCMNTRMGNETAMLTAAIAVSTLGGWAVMALLFFFWLPSLAEYRHMQGMLEGQAEEAEGVLRLTDSYFAIPRSITVRRVELEKEETDIISGIIGKDRETLPLQVDAPLARLLPPDGTRVRVRFVRRYITAWEASDAEAEKVH